MNFRRGGFSEDQHSSTVLGSSNHVSCGIGGHPHGRSAFSRNSEAQLTAQSRVGWLLGESLGDGGKFLGVRDGVTRNTKSKVNAQRCTSGRRMKHISKHEGVRREQVCEHKFVGPRLTRASFQRYDREYNSLHHMGPFVRGASPSYKSSSQPSHPTVLSRPPQVSTMKAESQKPKWREGTAERLNAAIEATNLAEKVSSIAPAKAVFGSINILLTLIRVRPPFFCPDLLQVHTQPELSGE